jgi:hypothetical protein
VNTAMLSERIEGEFPDMQHEVSRGLSIGLSSTPEMASRNFKLGVEVRQREQLLNADEQLPSAYEQMPSADEQLPAASRSADELRAAASLRVDELRAIASLRVEGLLKAVAHPVPHDPDGAAAHASAREESDTIIIDHVQQMLQSGRLQERRLDVYAGPFGYKVMSGGSSSQVADHAASSVLYAKLHGLEVVFAVHFKVRRASDQRKPITFPAWPAIGLLNEQVNS